MTDKVIQDIVKSLRCTVFCCKLDEGVLQLVRKFYANMEEKKDDSICMRQMSDHDKQRQQQTNSIAAPNHEEDDYFVLMDEGVDTNEL